MLYYYILLFYYISRLIEDGLKTPTATIMIQKPTVRKDRLFTMTVAITDDANELRYKVKNTIDILSLYQRVYSIRAVVFSSSEPVIDYARKNNITVVQEVERNSFGVPLYRPMLEKQKQLFPSHFYCYINSDILIDPSLFSLLQSFVRLHSLVNTPILFASRVYEVPIENVTISTRTMKEMKESYQAIPEGKIRIAGSADIFIYTNDYQFETFPDAVIGRIAIDNIAIAHAKRVRAFVVDITQTGHHIHQGVDRYSSRKREETDKNYNLVYFNQFNRYKGALNNADMIYNNDTRGYETK